MSLTIAIDPGMNGALAVLQEDGTCAFLADLPVITDKSLSWIDGGQLMGMILANLAGESATCIIERVASRPMQGVASVFKFGTVYGSILGVVQSMCIPIEFVTPVAWKSHYGIGKDKKEALHKARLLFPMCELHLKKHDGRAEALLIGRYHQKNKPT